MAEGAQGQADIYIYTAEGPCVYIYTAEGPKGQGTHG